MNLYEILLISAALSIDALSIGASCAMRKIRIPFLSKMIICMIGCLVTFLSVAAGGFLCRIFPEKSGNYLSIAMLIFLGLYIIIGAFKKNDQNIQKKDYNYVEITAEIMKKPDSCDLDQSENIETGEAVYIGIAVSADSLAAGLGAGMGGTGYILPIVCGIFQFAFLYFGEKLGEKLSLSQKFSQKNFSIFSGMVFLLLALIRLFS